MSRQSSTPRAPWWVAVLLPAFIIGNGWALDLLAAHIVTSYGSTAEDTFGAYAVWSWGDLVAKWLIYGAVAAILVTQCPRLNALPSRQWVAPWLLVILLMSLEIGARATLGQLPARGTLWGQVLRQQLVTPGRVRAYAISGPIIISVVPTESKPDARTLLWVGRPLVAFVVVLALITVGQMLGRRVRARLDRGEM